MSELHVDPDRWFALSADENVVECWTAFPIQFDTKPNWQKVRLMPSLRAAIAGLDIKPGECVAAIFSSDDPTERDAENAVLTNPGANTFSSTPDSFRFERSFTRPGPPVELRRVPGYDPYNYCYRFTPTSPDASLTHWRETRRLADWPPVPLHGWTKGNARGPWLSMVRARKRVHCRTHGCHDGYFGLRLTLDVPTNSTAQLVTNLEWVVDGVIASFQRETDAGWLARIAPQLTEFLTRDGFNAEETEVVAGLTAGLAVLPGVPWESTAAYPKVNSVDEHLVAGWAERRRRDDVDGARLAGSLFAVEQT